MVYVMNELYYSPDGIAKHFELGQQQPWFGDLMEYINNHAVAVDAGSTTVVHSQTDDVQDCAIRKGDTNITVCFRVPKRSVKEVENFFAAHEARTDQRSSKGGGG